MVESKVFRVVGLDEVVDSDAFRVLALQAELGMPSEAEEENTEDRP